MRSMMEISAAKEVAIREHEWISKQNTPVCGNKETRLTNLPWSTLSANGLESSFICCLLGLLTGPGKLTEPDQVFDKLDRSEFPFFAMFRFIASCQAEICAHLKFLQESEFGSRTNA
ncbi:uncharacterized protein PHALS_10843 [Plasmopara halstedii]|uniref:Uncharacterized protein n=1 Tax=Plasmopara halstedii TaxID=4781 RepID=A0A0P1AJD4_PLAHL|nr:uncharacterized protein PHALS_10843 [Plasmopara halstedii]CEG40657.1 hypothetical protein PHALS_10843 [Plasmopara halstedii]|eukprot:XP_024577026.1 hypothetical protein PHALS_10843 [Plasmopara halstedii]